MLQAGDDKIGHLFRWLATLRPMNRLLDLLKIRKHQVRSQPVTWQCLKTIKPTQTDGLED